MENIKSLNKKTPFRNKERRDFGCNIETITPSIFIDMPYNLKETNHLMTLQDENEEWIRDLAAMQEHIIQISHNSSRPQMGNMKTWSVK